VIWQKVLSIFYFFPCIDIYHDIPLIPLMEINGKGNVFHTVKKEANFNLKTVAIA